jgi:hypothetical protein
VDPATLSAVILAVATIIGLVVAYIQWRENHSDRISGKLSHTIKTVVQQENESLKTAIVDHAPRLTQTGDRLNRIEDLLKSISADQRGLTEAQTKMGVKVDMYWTTLEALAMNSAKGLHQPDSRRRHIDSLLESFMEGVLTDSERIELKKILVQIRNYEPGGPELGFPVYPGEHTLAAILLSTMDVVSPAKMAVLGHAAHRSVAHKQKREEKQHE